MGKEAENYEGGSSSDEEKSNEDETDAVDDCSSNHPVVHHLLILLFFLTLTSRCTRAYLEQIANVSQQVFDFTGDWSICIRFSCWSSLSSRDKR